MKTISLSWAAAPLAFAFAVPAFAQQAAPFSPQDLVTLGRLGGTAVSPDGKSAAIIVTRTDPDTLKRTSALQLIALDGRAQGAPIWPGASDPAYGPDGSLYFLASAPPGLVADEDAKTQVYRIPASPKAEAGTPRTTLLEFQKVTNFKTDVAGFKLSPDGKRIAVWGDIARDCPTFGCDSDGNTALPDPAQVATTRTGLASFATGMHGKRPATTAVSLPSILALMGRSSAMARLPTALWAR
jgi:dipeptidyl aminopeptidase/acylaminoacyl peptidase